MTGKALKPRFSAVASATESSATMPALPSLSAGLQRAISDSLNLQPTADGDGYTWQPPEHLPQPVIDEAKRAAAQLEAALAQAPMRQRLEWLSGLAKLTAGKLSLEEILERMKAMAAEVDYPALCFTPATRRDAAYRFKFFPTFAELARFFEEVQSPYRDRVRRLKRVAGAKVEQERRGRDWSELSEAERQAHERLMVEVRARLAAAAPLSRGSPQASGEGREGASPVAQEIQ